MDESITIEHKLQKYDVYVVKKETFEEIEKKDVEKEQLQINLTEDDNRKFLFNFFAKVQVQELLELVGEEGRFQFIVLIILCLYNFFYAFVGFFISYLYYMPEFYCYDAQKNTYECNEDAACYNPYGYVIKSDITSLVTEFEMYCHKRYLKELTQGFFIVSAGLMAFLFGVLSDKLGRRRVFLFAWYFSIFGIAFSFVSSNLVMITIGNIFAWAGMDIFFSMVFIYSNEILGGSLRQKSNAILFFFWAFGEIMINVINIFINNYKINYIIQIIPLFIMGLGFYFLKESPYILYKLRKVKQLIQVLLFIAKENRQEIELIEEKLFHSFQIQNLGVQELYQIKKLKIKSKDKETPGKGQFQRYWHAIQKMMKDKSLMLKLIGATTLAGNIYVGYGLSILIPQRIGLSNIYVNGIFLGVSELIGNFIMIPLGNKVKRRHLNFFCSFSITICCLILLIIELIKEHMNESAVQWSQTLLSSLIKMILCANFAMIFTYCAELFPTKIRGLCLGLCVLLGRSATIFALGLEGITDEFGIQPMIGVIFGSCLTMPVALLMPETFGQGVSNQLKLNYSYLNSFVLNLIKQPFLQKSSSLKLLSLYSKSNALKSFFCINKHSLYQSQSSIYC